MAKPGGTIYAIGTQETTCVKIGYTKLPIQQRLSQLQIGQPFPLHVVAAVPVETDVQSIEKWVHRFLATERKRGEWFDLSIDTAQLEALIVRAMQSVAEENALLPGIQEVDMRALGERLLLLRRRADLSQHELAKRASVDVMTISRLERGTKKRLEVEQLARLARAFDVTTDYLLGL